MHFTPKQKDIVVDDDNAINIVLGQNNIKLVRDIKFLGVIIDDKLSWKPHTKYGKLWQVKYDETCYSW